VSAPSIEWRYLPNGRMTHVVETPNADVAALCGRRAALPENWFGTGSQDEYEQAESLPKCRLCAHLVGASS
jgi:hypothetical protein